MLTPTVHTLQSRSATHRYLSYRNTCASVQNRINVDSSIDYGEVFMSRKYAQCLYVFVMGTDHGENAELLEESIKV